MGVAGQGLAFDSSSTPLARSSATAPPLLRLRRRNVLARTPGRLGGEHPSLRGIILARPLTCQSRPVRISVLGRSYSSDRGHRLGGTLMTEALRIYEGILTTFQVVSDQVRESLAPFKITPAQFGVLRRVRDGEVVSLTELARRLRCTNANVTRLVEN